MHRESIVRGGTSLAKPPPTTPPWRGSGRLRHPPIQRHATLEGMRAFLIRTVLTAFALWVAVELVPGLSFDFGTLTNSWAKFGVVLLIAVIFGLVNAFIKPVVQVLSIPLYILTLGLIHIIINAFMLEIVAWITNNLTSWGLNVDSFFWAAIFGAVVISIVGWLTDLMLPDRANNPYS